MKEIKKKNLKLKEASNYSIVPKEVDNQNRTPEQQIDQLKGKIDPKSDSVEVDTRLMEDGDGKQQQYREALNHLKNEGKDEFILKYGIKTYKEALNKLSNLIKENATKTYTIKEMKMLHLEKKIREGKPIRVGLLKELMLKENSEVYLAADSSDSSGQPLIKSGDKLLYKTPEGESVVATVEGGIGRKTPQGRPMYIQIPRNDGKGTKRVKVYSSDPNLSIPEESPLKKSLSSTSMVNAAKALGNAKHYFINAKTDEGMPYGNEVVRKKADMIMSAPNKIGEMFRQFKETKGWEGSHPVWTLLKNAYIDSETGKLKIGNLMDSPENKRLFNIDLNEFLDVLKDKEFIGDGANLPLFITMVKQMGRYGLVHGDDKQKVYTKLMVELEKLKNDPNINQQYVNTAIDMLESHLDNAQVTHTTRPGTPIDKTQSPYLRQNMLNQKDVDYVKANKEFQNLILNSLQPLVNHAQKGGDINSDKFKLRSELATKELNQILDKAIANDLTLKDPYMAYLFTELVNSEELKNKLRQVSRN